MTELKGKCPKCGSLRIEQQYHINKENILFGRHCGTETINSSKVEHIHYYCKGCRYDWLIECSSEKGVK